MTTGPKLTISGIYGLMLPITLKSFDFFRGASGATEIALGGPCISRAVLSEAQGLECWKVAEDIHILKCAATCSQDSVT